jgi:hypothetical protein
LTEQSWNLIENKGAGLKGPSKAGMSRKTNEMLAENGNVTENKGGRW